MSELPRSSTGSKKHIMFKAEQEENKTTALIVHRKLKNFFTQSCIRDASKFAVASALLSALLKVLDHNLQLDFLSKFMPDKIVYSSFTSIMCTLIVFQTIQSLAQYREGASLIYKINASWLDASSTLLSFTRHSKSEKTVVNVFRHTVIRLFSLLNMLCLAELESQNHRESKAAVSFEVIDTCGLDLETLNSIRSSENKVEIVAQLIQTMAVDGLAEGVLTVPAPLLTRAFQDLGSGLMNYYHACNIAHINIPLPYVCVTESLLVVHAIFTPFAMCTFNLEPALAFIFTLLAVMVPWTFNFLAMELSNPFGSDANDLPVGHLQYDLNERLHTFLELADHPTPTTDMSVVKGGSAAMIKATTTIRPQQELKYTLEDFFDRICNQAEKKTVCKQEVFFDEEQEEEEEQQEFEVPVCTVVCKKEEEELYSDVPVKAASFRISEMGFDEVEHDVPVRAGNTTNNVISQVASDVVDHEGSDHTANGELYNLAADTAESSNEKTNRSAVAPDVVDHQVPAHADSTTNNVISQVASDAVYHEKVELSNPAANTAGSCNEKVNRTNRPTVLAQVLGQDERLEHENMLPRCEMHLHAGLADVHLEKTLSPADCPGPELPEFTTPASTPRVVPRTPQSDTSEVSPSADVAGSGQHGQCEAARSGHVQIGRCNS